MLRGLPHLAKFMPKPKDARRQIPDPQNEPNFCEITKKYPLPDDPEFGKNGDLPEAQAKPEEIGSKSISSAVQPRAAMADLSRLMGNPMSASSQLGVAVGPSALASASYSTLGLPAVGPSALASAASYSSLGLPQLQTVYPARASAPMPVMSGLHGSTMMDPSNATIAAALRAGIAIGASQPPMLPSSYNPYQYQGLFPPQQQGPFGGRF
jgi:hypothetical protein